MNYPPNPFLKKQSEALSDRQYGEQKYRGFIITGIVLGALIFIGCTVILFVTVQISRMHDMTREMTDQLVTMDTAAAVQDVAAGEDYYNYTADYREEENDKLAMQVKLLIPDTSTRRNEIIESVNTIQTSTDNICQEIRKLCNEFKDSVANAYSYNDIDVTTHFFITAGRGSVLLMQLQDYRKSIITEVDKTALSYSLEECLPLDDGYNPNYATEWDADKLSGYSSDAEEYLKTMENEVRNFESKALERIQLFR